MVPVVNQKVEVLSNIALGNEIYRMRLSCHRQYARSVPGQFVMVRSSGFDPLLPRPFSIHRLIKKEDSVAGLELLYKVVGKSTRELSLRQAGDSLPVLVHPKRSDRALRLGVLRAAAPPGLLKHRRLAVQGLAPLATSFRP